MRKAVIAILFIALLIAVSASAHTPYQTNPIDTKEYRLVVPKHWVVELVSKGSWMRFYIGDKEVGMTEIMGYYPSNGLHLPIPNHSGVLSEEQLGGFCTEVIEVKLVMTPPAAAHENWERYETHFYFLQPEKKQAIRLRFYDEYVDEETALGIAQSVQIKEHRPPLSTQ